MLSLLKSFTFFFIDTFLLILFRFIRFFLKSSAYDNSVLKLDHIGDFFLGIDALYSIFSKQEKSILICSSEISEVAEITNFIDHIFLININKYCKNFFYRAKINWKLSGIFCSNTLNFSYSRVFLIGDTISRFIRCRNKIAFFGNNSNQKILENSISQNFYDSVYRFDDIVFEGSLNDSLYETVFNKKVVRANSRIFQSTIKPPILIDDYVVINLGSNSVQKRWSVDNFVNIASELNEQYHFKFVLVGSSHEIGLASSFLKKINDSLEVFNYCGKTSISQYFNLIANARFIITNDTSSAHIAPFFNVKSFVIQGGWHHGRFLPYSKDFRATPPVLIFNKMDCYNCDLKCIYDKENLNNTFPCISSISTSEVLEVINNNLAA